MNDRFTWEEDDFEFLNDDVEKFNLHHDELGRFTSGGDSELGAGYSSNAKLIDGVIHTSDVNDAVLALHENRKVRLDQVRSVSTLIDKLGKIAADMIAKGEDAPEFNLCNVSVPDSNLFCADNKGYSRVQMPQIRDAVDVFKQHLLDMGYQVRNTTEQASYLRSTQNELSGVGVARIAKKIENGTYYHPGERLFVSKDNYIVDGHHRWAAVIGVDARDGKLGDKTIPVMRINMPIIELLKEAEKFTGPRVRMMDKRLGKFNPNHDEKGRFAESGGSGGVSPEQVSEFADSVKAKYGLHTLSLYISGNTGYLRLDYIIVPKGAQGAGIGTKAMDDIVAFADQHKLNMSLTTALRDKHHGTTSSSRLKEFYKRFGFKENKGRNYNAAISDNMIRLSKVAKFNPNHDERGRFAESDSSGGVTGNFSRTTAEKFLAARAKSSRAMYLAPKTAEDVKDWKMFLNKEGTTGVAVDDDGDIHNLFNNGGPPGAGAEALVTAIENGGRTLDCYAGYLPAFYHQFGFVETNRLKFKLPPGRPWDYAKMDHPDVVFMQWRGYIKGGTKATLEHVKNKEGWEAHTETKEYLNDYDTGKEKSRRGFKKAAAKRAGNHSDSEAGVWPRPNGTGNQSGTGTGEELRRIVKYNENHDERGRFTTGGGGGAVTDIGKFNPNHDELGRFTTGSGGTTTPRMTDAQRAAEQARWLEIEETRERKEQEEMNLSPQSWDELSSDKQDRIQQEYESQTFAEALESEQNNWRDNGDAEHDAANTVADTFNRTRGMHDEAWVDAVDTYLKEREEEGLSRIPYTRTQLLDAMKLDAGEWGHSSRAELTVDFNNDKLLEPDTWVPGQMTFAGFEQPDPSDALTQEMRDGLTEVIQDAFKEEVRSVADDLEPPEYLAESARELTGELWSQMSEDERWRWAQQNTDLVDRSNAPQPQPRSYNRAADAWKQSLPAGVTPDEFLKGMNPTNFQGSLQLVPRGNGLYYQLVFEGGEIKRVMDFDGKWVRHDFFQLPEGRQGAGTAKDIMASQIALYDKLGMDMVHTNADIDVGRYAWAKYGFVPTQAAWDSLRSTVNSHLSTAYLTSQLSEAERDVIEKMTSNKEPKTIWALSDLKREIMYNGKKLTLGNYLLRYAGQSWIGMLDLKDSETRARFKAYVSSKKKK